MRIAGDSNLDLLASLNRTQSEQEKALAEISSGKRISVASDDPAGFADWLANRSETSRNDEFQHSVSTLNEIFQTADSTLNSVVTALNRAISLGVRGSTSTLPQNDRNATAGEVSLILDNIAELANTSFRGTYLFGGTNTQVKPFSGDSGSGWSYSGNSGVMQAEIGDGRNMQTNVPGTQVFMADGANVFASLSYLVTALKSGDMQGISNATNQVRAAFDHVSCERVFYGNAMSQLATQSDGLKSEQLELARQENEIAGADQAESISQFLNAQTAREQSLAAAGQISRLTLLDYLK